MSRKSWTGSLCAAEGCDRIATSDALCDRDYRRKKNTGTTDTPKQGAPPRPRLCKICGETNPDKFYPRNASTCKKCHSARGVINQKNTPLSVKAAYRRKSRLKQLYNMTEQEYDYMLEMQNHRCLTCHNKFKNSKDTHVDHDHACCPGEKSCGECIRGILCSSCNQCLGYLHDSIELAQALAAYLKDPPGRRYRCGTIAA